MVKPTLKNCLLCGEDLPKEASVSSSNNYYAYRCEVCGNVAIHAEFQPNHIPAGKGYLISGWARERTEKKEKPLIILPNHVAGTVEGIAVDAILSLPSIPRNISEKIYKILYALHRLTTYFGENIKLTGYDYSLAYLENKDALPKFMHQVSTITDWIRINSTGIYSVSVKGLQELESLSRRRPDTRDGFVAMQFGDAALDQAYQEGIAPAIQDAGYQAIQMAYMEHNNYIMDEMLACIRRSKFLVADLTYQNQNVYFEAGFAQGLGIPVIYTCWERDATKIKFDIQQINQIRWESAADLRVKLKNRILATVG